MTLPSSLILRPFPQQPFRFECSTGHSASAAGSFINPIGFVRALVFSAPSVIFNDGLG